MFTEPSTPRPSLSRVPAALAALVAPVALVAIGGVAQANELTEAEVKALEEPTTESCLDALAGGEVTVKLRYRIENVDVDGVSKDATASTLRTVVNYATQPFHGFQTVIEFEDVRQVGDTDYNDTLNGKARPVIADPENTELNQAYVDYSCDASGVKARVGRQRIKLDNDRFIGNVGWRQNEQTFDAVSLQRGFGEGGNVFVAYIDNVNRVFGESSPIGDHRMGSTIVNASWKCAAGKLTGYWYNLDYDNANALSTSTFGARFTGSHEANDDLNLLYSLEAATQDDTGDNPNSVSAEYYLAEVGADIGPVTLKAGMESLSGSSTPGDVFTTPLATLHAHNGWADMFLGTPPGGLEDTYVAVSGKVMGAKCAAIYHNFEAESGGGDYGSELDLVVSRPVNKRVAWGLKYADYMEDGLFADTQKIWGWVSVSL